jgi:sugar lactone lactonase YvrE
MTTKLTILRLLAGGHRSVLGVVAAALAGALFWTAPGIAQSSGSSLRTLGAVVTDSLRLPVDGVRGILVESGGDMLLLVTRNRGLSAPDSSYSAVLMRYRPTTGSLETVREERDGFETGLSFDGEFLWSGGGAVGSEGGVFQLDANSGEILQMFPATGYHPAGLSWDGSHLWQIDADARKLYRLDTEEGRVSRKVSSPGFYPTGLTHDGFHFWSADASTGRLYRHRGSNGRVDAVISDEAYMRPGEFVSLAWDGGGIWCVSASNSIAIRIELLR